MDSEAQKPFKIKPWMVISFALALACILFNFDPVGNRLDEIFGKDAKRWAINIIAIGVFIYFAFFGRKK